MPITYIIINGPPQSGKSTVAREVCAILNEKARAVIESFNAPMKHFFATALSISYGSARKDVSLAVLNGYSIRDCMIDMSEKYIRERYGPDIFARWLTYRVLRLAPVPAYVIIDGAGIIDEVECVSPRVIVRVDRPGTDFAQDSRTYIDNPNYVVNNDGDRKKLDEQAKEIARAINDHAR